MGNPSLILDDNGRVVLGAIDDSDGEFVSVKGDGTSYTVRVNNWVWNTVTLAWERMKQPTVELTGDLTVSMGDVEALLAENYWKDQRIEYDTDGNAIYRGLNTTNGAATSATSWYVYKYTWSSGNCTRIQGPEIGAWDNRVGLSW